MLSIESCKKILTDNGDKCYSDDEVKLIRRFLYESAKTLIESKNEKI